MSHFASAGQSNIHETNTLIYLAGKLPFNFFTNVCDVRLWTITHANNNPKLFPNEPLVKYDVPSWILVGAMRQVGIYSLDATFSLVTFRIWTTFLGVLRSVAILFIIWRRWRLARRRNFVCWGSCTGLWFGGVLSGTLDRRIGRKTSGLRLAGSVHAMAIKLLQREKGNAVAEGPRF